MPRIGVLVDQWPALGTDSTTQMNFLLIQELSRLGQDVTVLKPVRKGSETATQVERREVLAQMDHVETRSLVTPHRIDSPVVRLIPQGLRWSRHHWYWQLQCADELADVVAREDITMTITYGDTGIAWLASTQDRAGRRVILGDRPDLPYLYRQRHPFQNGKRYLSPSWWARWLLIWRLKRDFWQLVKELGEMECVSAAHAKDIQSRGFTAAYCRSAVTPSNARNSYECRPPLKLLVLGNLAGTASHEGFVTLATRLAPYLMGELSAGEVRIRVVGSGVESVPPHDLERVRRLGVEVLGFVADLEEQFAWADALLIPTTIPLGVRIRAIEGWSRGLPTLGHSSIALGLPEAQDHRNCRLASAPHEMAAIIRELSRDCSQLATLQAFARSTFESHFLGRTGNLAREMLDGL